MNARQMLAKLDGYGGIIPFNSEELDVTLRALRLLAAAEANDWTSPETNRLSDEISRRTFAQNIIKAEDVFDALDLSRTFEQRCNALAARVRELERGIEIATDRLTGPGGVLSAIDAARVRELEPDEARLKFQHFNYVKSCVATGLHGAMSYSEWIAAIDAARSK